MHDAFGPRRCTLISVLLSGALLVAPAANFAGESMCDQEAVESIASKLTNAPKVRAAKDVVRDKYLLPRLRATASEPRSGLETAVEEMAFSALLEVAGSDATRTHPIWHLSPPHVQGDQVIPGSRFAFDNPDRVYRFAPISADSTYEIHGRFRPGAKPHKFVIETLAAQSAPVGWGGNGGNTSALILEDSDIRADGSFVITADRRPTGDRKAHLYIPQNATHFYFRDTLADWSKELPAELTLQRTAGTTVVPESIEALALRAPHVIESYAKAQYRWIDKRVPAAGNTVITPVARPGSQSWGATAGRQDRVPVRGVRGGLLSSL